jgi:protein-ribulosamine 3-kinase
MGTFTHSLAYTKKMPPVPVPTSICRALSLSFDPSKSTLSTSGLGSGFTTTGRIHALVPSDVSSSSGRPEEDEEEERLYFVKTLNDGQAASDMFHGEFESLNAIADVVPGFCPRALAWGSLEGDDNDGNGSAKSKGFFLATQYLDLGSGRSRPSVGSSSSLATRLGKLHNTPAPPDLETGQRRFGFPVPTFCGDTRQPNRFHASWADFYANERLTMILHECERRNGKEPSLRQLVERTVRLVVPTLLANGHLGYGKNGHGSDIIPVVVHGDLWSGNAGRGRIVGHGGRSSNNKQKQADQENGDGDEYEIADVVYDPSACYAHSEYELGIMRMFGGFGTAFFDAYHQIVPKTEPVDEYNDRGKLYELCVFFCSPSKYTTRHRAKTIV